MHRRAQVEIAWFISLSDAGFAEFAAEPRSAHLLAGVGEEFLGSRRAGDRGHRENHQPRRQGGGVLDQVEVRGPPRTRRRPANSCTLPAPARTSTTPATRCSCKWAARAGAAAGAGHGDRCCARWHTPCRGAHAQPHPRPDRQPHHRGQGIANVVAAPGPARASASPA